MVVFNTSQLGIFREKYREIGWDNIELSSKIEIGWPKWETDLIFFSAHGDPFLLYVSPRSFWGGNGFLLVNPEACFSVWVPPVSLLLTTIRPGKVHVSVSDAAFIWGVDKRLRGLPGILRNSESHDLASVLILGWSSQSLGWERDRVYSSKGLSEPRWWPESDLSQMTGNEAQHKQHICSVSTLSKNCQAGLQHLWTNTNKINLVTKGCGHSHKRRNWRELQRESGKEKKGKKKKPKNIRFFSWMLCGLNYWGNFLNYSPRMFRQSAYKITGQMHWKSCSSSESISPNGCFVGITFVQISPPE